MIRNKIALPFVIVGALPVPLACSAAALAQPQPTGPVNGGVAPAIAAAAQDSSGGMSATDAASPQKVAPENAAVTQGAIGDIVVTAERREQSVQKAAATIQVIGTEQIRSAGLSTPGDLTKLTTGLNLSFGGSNTQIFIRGVGDFSYSPQDNPGVAFNVDGIYVGRPNGVAGNFYDVARLEVLKGPQGTLYGRNANGGSINLITNEPKLNSRTLNLDIEGGNYDLIHTSGAVNLPIGTDAAIRGAFNIAHRNGYLSDGTDDDIQQDGRLRFKWEPNSNITLHLNADYSHIGGKGAGYTYLPRRPGSSPWESVTEPEANAYRASALPLGPLINTAEPVSSLNNKFYNFSGQLDWKFDFATLTVIPAYRHVQVDSVTIPSFRIDDHTTGDQKSLETRLGNSTPLFTWVIGAFLYNERDDNADDVTESPLLQQVTVTLHPRTTAYAGFGQTTVTVLDGLRLIGGARYTYEKRKLTGQYINQSPITGGPNDVLEDFTGKKNFSGVTYKAGVEYDVAPRSLLFFTVSTGFKSGGLGQTVAPLNVYKPEKLRAFEIGSKNRFFDDHLQLNLGAYHWHYTGIQDSRTAFDPLGVVNFLVFNAGSATIYGATADIVYQPSAADQFSLSAEYAHSRYDSFNFEVPAFVFNPASTGCSFSGPFPATPAPVIRGNCKGFEVARVPKWTGIAGYDHVFTLPASDTIKLGGTAKFSSARWLGADFTPAERGRGYVVFDAELTYTSPGRNLSVGAFARNLTNKAYYLGGQQQPFVGGLFEANIAPPRTYGLRASLKFGS